MSVSISLLVEETGEPRENNQHLLDKYSVSCIQMNERWYRYLDFGSKLTIVYYDGLLYYPIKYLDNGCSRRLSVKEKYHTHDNFCVRKTKYIMRIIPDYNVLHNNILGMVIIWRLA